MASKEQEHRSMSIPGTIAAGLALALLGAGASPSMASTVAQGAEAPNIAGTWLNSDATGLKDLRGMAVFLEFWGSG
jgi:hypothetical protein